MAINRQTIDIPQPIYDTIDNAVCSVTEMSCEININYISKDLYNIIL